MHSAAAAKSRQSCPTLCDPIDGSLPGSPVPGILQARTLEWVAISFSTHESEKWKWSRSVVSNPQRPHGLQPSRLLRPWGFPGKSTGVGCHHLLCYLPEFAQTHVHRVNDAIQPSHPLLPLFLLPLIFANIKVFSKESALHIRWPKYWGFSFSPSNEYSGMISFRIDWFDLLAAQGITPKSLLQHHSSKASVLLGPVFFMIQLSHPSITTGKTIALTRQTFVGKVMSLRFNMLFRLVIAFLPRSKHLLISQSAVILEPKTIKSVTVSIVSPSICHEVMGPDAIILVFWMLSCKPAVSSFFYHLHQDLQFLFTFCH